MDHAVDEEVWFSPDGAWLCVRTRNRLRPLHLFHVPSREFRTLGAGGTGLWTFSRDGAWLVVCAENHLSCTVVELATGRETVIEPGGTIGLVAIDPTSRWLRIPTVQGADQLWQLADGEPHAPSDLPRMYQAEPSEVLRLFATQDRHEAMWSNLIKKWTAHVGTPPERGRPRFSDGETRVATQWSAEEAQLWDVATGRLEHRVRCPYPASGLSLHGFTPDNRFLVGTTYSPWSFVIWEVATGAVAGFRRLRFATTASLGVGPDGASLWASAYDAGEVFLCDLPDGRIRHTFRAPWRRTANGQFHADGCWLEVSCCNKRGDFDFYSTLWEL
jgi:hypothetical protein